MFTSDVDVAASAHWLAEGVKKYNVQIHGWVFMTNHAHIILTPQQDKAVSGLMQYLVRLYSGNFLPPHILLTVGIARVHAHGRSGYKGTQIRCQPQAGLSDLFRGSKAIEQS